MPERKRVVVVPQLLDLIVGDLKSARTALTGVRQGFRLGEGVGIPFQRGSSQGLYILEREESNGALPNENRGATKRTIGLATC